MASLLTLVRNNGSIDPRESTLRAKKEELCVYVCVYAREDEDVAFPSLISLLRLAMKQSVFVWPLGHDRPHTVTYSLSC